MSPVDPLRITLPILCRDIVRSEGGTDCQRQLEATGNLPNLDGAQAKGGAGGNTTGVTKKEEAWSGPVAL